MRVSAIFLSFFFSFLAFSLFYFFLLSSNCASNRCVSFLHCLYNRFPVQYDSMCKARLFSGGIVLHCGNSRFHPRFASVCESNSRFPGTVLRVNCATFFFFCSFNTWLLPCECLCLHRSAFYCFASLRSPQAPLPETRQGHKTLRLHIAGKIVIRGRRSRRAGVWRFPAGHKWARFSRWRGGNSRSLVQFADELWFIVQFLGDGCCLL